MMRPILGLREQATEAGETPERDSIGQGAREWALSVF